MERPYPLAWPQGWPRTPAVRRRSAQFSGRANDGQVINLSVAKATQRLIGQLDALKATDEVLSTNVQLRLDGLPRSDRSEPDNPGAAVYFRLGGKPTALACDRWNRTADNIAALAKHIEALRGMDRWGVGSVEQAFTGYQALPAPEQWWQVLGVHEGATAETINTAYRELATKAHPDRGGSDAAMARLNTARDTGLSAQGAA